MSEQSSKISTSIVDDLIYSNENISKIDESEALTNFRT